jgi:hypothetical protein
MKIKCINNNGFKKSLTVSKTYEVIYIYNDGDYEIIDDKGNEFWYPKDYFKTLYEIRNEKIDKLLE